MAWSGLPQLVIIPFVPMLMGRFDVRHIVVLGLVVFGASFLMNTHMSADYSGDQFFIPNVVRAAGQALVLGPMSGIAMVGIAQLESAGASGIFNMMRNLGGAFGTALLGTFVTKREQFHSNVIGAQVSLYSETVRDRIDLMTKYYVTRHQRSVHRAWPGIVALGQAVRRQALIDGAEQRRAFAVLEECLSWRRFSFCLTRKGRQRRLAGTEGKILLSAAAVFLSSWLAIKLNCHGP